MGHTRTSHAVRASRWPAFGALAFTMISAGLVALTLAEGAAQSVQPAIGGYLFGAVAATLLVQVHRATRNRASVSPWYNPQPGLDRVAVTALVLGLACGAWHAFIVATELAK